MPTIWYKIVDTEELTSSVSRSAFRSAMLNADLDSQGCKVSSSLLGIFFPNFYIFNGDSLNDYGNELLKVKKRKIKLCFLTYIHSHDIFSQFLRQYLFIKNRCVLLVLLLFLAVFLFVLFCLCLLCCIKQFLPST